MFRRNKAPILNDFSAFCHPHWVTQEQESPLDLQLWPRVHVNVSEGAAWTLRCGINMTAASWQPRSLGRAQPLSPRSRKLLSVTAFQSHGADRQCGHGEAGWAPCFSMGRNRFTVTVSPVLLDWPRPLCYLLHLNTFFSPVLFSLPLFLMITFCTAHVKHNKSINALIYLLFTDKNCLHTRESHVICHCEACQSEDTRGYFHETPCDAGHNPVVWISWQQ